MRSCLIVDPPAFSNALGGGAPALLLRLGAYVENEARRRARADARALVEDARRLPGAPRIFAQIASVKTDVIEGDLDALIGAGLEGVFLEACEGRAGVQQLSVKLAWREAEAGRAEGSTKIVALAAQTPAAVFALGGYAGASPRLAALAFDEDALRRETRADPATARALLVFGAAAAGVAALDCAPHGDGAEVAAACVRARRLGFDGMLAQAPEQIGAIENDFLRPG